MIIPRTIISVQTYNAIVKRKSYYSYTTVIQSKDFWHYICGYKYRKSILPYTNVKSCLRLGASIALPALYNDNILADYKPYDVTDCAYISIFAVNFSAYNLTSNKACVPSTTAGLVAGDSGVGGGLKSSGDIRRLFAVPARSTLHKLPTFNVSNSVVMV